ncbi:hypothetical protein SAMN05192541_1474 [Bradyrhizobium arachidis]|nr:hypothetical protein SAMN05192541_1474 [Bradyrhizobium arachidis]
MEHSGIAKSMVVEAALERFLDPAPTIEDVMHERLDRICIQLERLEHEIRIVSDTAAVHARYHLTVTPAMPQSQQREACQLGHDRFKVLAEQVDRRVRLGRSLMRETIEGLAPTSYNGSLLECDEDTSIGSAATDQETLRATVADPTPELTAAVEEGGGNPNFRHLPNAFC